MTVDISLHEFNGPVYLVYDGQIGFEIERDDQIKIRTSESSLSTHPATETKMVGSAAFETEYGVTN